MVMKNKNSSLQDEKGIYKYLKNRGFVQVLYAKDVGIVYRYSEDENLILHLYFDLETVDLYYNKEYDRPYYTGLYFKTEFLDVLNHTLYNIDHG